MSPNLLTGFQHIDFLSLSPQLLYSGRRDTKYILHYIDWEDIIGSLKDAYSLVMHHGMESQTYSTIYYDTHDLSFYFAHHNGHGNRIKMRTRRYSDGNSFFEIKQKTNRGITLKERYSAPIDHIDGMVQQLEVVYDRITMYDKNFEEKLTFDFNLLFRTKESELEFNSIVIAESKKNKLTHSKFKDELKSRKIKSSSISKYCIGLASIKPELKQNNFKKILSAINKLKNKYEIPTSV